MRRAVIVGNDLSVLGTTKPDGTEVRTMWGELAYQLGGRDGFDEVGRAECRSGLEGEERRRQFEATCAQGREFGRVVDGDQ